MQYKALVMDIDGTLLPRGSRTLDGGVADALTDLQRRGTVVITATGRAPKACPAALFGSFIPDYQIYVNGAYVVAPDGGIVYEDRFTAGQVGALTDYTQAGGYAVCFSFEDGYYAYSGYPQYNARYRANPDDPHYVHDGGDHTRHLQSLPYAGFALMPATAAADFHAANPDIRLVQVVEGAWDVCKADNHKARGLSFLLEKLGIGWPQVVAVGDGDNDIEMLRKAGMGVAMDNAPAQVKAAADYITASAEENGILQVVHKFFETA